MVALDSDVELDMVAYDKVTTEIRQIALDKNLRYGVESLETFQGLGIVIRMGDKIRRIERMMEADLKGLLRSDTDTHWEGLEDSALDLANYAIYLAMKLRGNLRK